MKKTIDGKEVPDRCWYYLLDFNDRDGWKTITSQFGGVLKLHQLTEDQFWVLFKIATNKDHGSNDVIVLNKRSKQKLEFIKGQGFRHNFPKSTPTLEWVGAVLDFLEEIEK